MQVEEPRSLITLAIHLRATIYWVLTGFSWNTLHTCLFLLLKLAFSIVWSYLTDSEHGFSAICGPFGGDAPTDAYTEDSAHSQFPCFAHSWVSENCTLPWGQSSPILGPGNPDHLSGQDWALNSAGEAEGETVCASIFRSMCWKQCL